MMFCGLIFHSTQQFDVYFIEHNGLCLDVWLKLNLTCPWCWLDQYPMADFQPPLHQTTPVSDVGWYMIHPPRTFIHDTWYMIHYTRYIIQDTWYMILYTWYMILYTWYMIHAWYMIIHQKFSRKYNSVPFTSLSRQQEINICKKW